MSVQPFQDYVREAVTTFDKVDSLNPEFYWEFYGQRLVEAARVVAGSTREWLCGASDALSVEQGRYCKDPAWAFEGHNEVCGWVIVVKEASL